MTAAPAQPTATQNVKSVSATSWTGGTLTYSNKLAIGTKNNFTPLSTGVWIGVGVTSAVVANAIAGIAALAVALGRAAWYAGGQRWRDSIWKRVSRRALVVFIACVLTSPRRLRHLPHGSDSH